MKVQWRALVNHTDKSKILQELGIKVGRPPLRREDYQDKELRSITAICLNHNLNRKNQNLLINEDLVYKEKGLENCLVPQWGAQATYLWEAKFAPQKMTKVKHTYNQWAGSWYCFFGEPNLDIVHIAISQCSEDSGDLQSANKKFGGVPVILNSFFYEYVLHTGGNWKGPIKKFRFKAQGPESSWAWVYTPFPVKRESYTTLTAEIDNYKPRSKTEYIEAVRKHLKDIPLSKEEKNISFHYGIINKSMTEEQAILINN